MTFGNALAKAWAEVRCSHIVTKKDKPTKAIRQKFLEPLFRSELKSVEAAKILGQAENLSCEISDTQQDILVAAFKRHSSEILNFQRWLQELNICFRGIKKQCDDYPSISSDNRAHFAYNLSKEHDYARCDEDERIELVSKVVISEFDRQRNLKILQAEQVEKTLRDKDFRQEMQNLLDTLWSEYRTKDGKSNDAYTRLCHDFLKCYSLQKNERVIDDKADDIWKEILAFPRPSNQHVAYLTRRKEIPKPELDSVYIPGPYPLDRSIYRRISTMLDGRGARIAPEISPRVAIQQTIEASVLDTGLPSDWAHKLFDIGLLLTTILTEEDLPRNESLEGAMLIFHRKWRKAVKKIQRRRANLGPESKNAMTKLAPEPFLVRQQNIEKRDNLFAARLWTVLFRHCLALKDDVEPDASEALGFLDSSFNSFVQQLRKPSPIQTDASSGSPNKAGILEETQQDLKQEDFADTSSYEHFQTITDREEFRRLLEECPLAATVLLHGYHSYADGEDLSTYQEQWSSCLKKVESADVPELRDLRKFIENNWAALKQIGIG